MTAASGKDLNRWFDKFNEQYFNGRLKSWSVTIGDHTEAPNVHGYCDRSTKTLFIGEVALFDRDIAQSTLLHEMTHASVGQWHGQRFMREMQRLEQADAPVHDAEFREAIRPTAAYVRSSIDDAMLESGLTLAQAQESVADFFGMTLEDLLRRFPKASKGDAKLRELVMSPRPWAEKRPDGI